ncbi:hypothetical protein [Streptomyces sp. DT171]|uniref:hypothetical protein n=1 Tax=Streptomyces sp. DT171 TaxID=3416524 RepID=UPI003CF36256
MLDSTVGFIGPGSYRLAARSILGGWQETSELVTDAVRRERWALSGELNGRVLEAPVRAPRPNATRSYSHAEYGRWERAVTRLRREQQRTAWLELHGLAARPSLVHGVVVR